MNSNEAIKIIKANFPDDCGKYSRLMEALTMAIESLEDKGNSDFFGATDFVDRVNKLLGANEYMAIKGFNGNSDEVICVVKTSNCEFNYPINLGILRSFYKDKKVKELLFDTVEYFREKEKECVRGD